MSLDEIEQNEQMKSNALDNSIENIKSTGIFDTDYLYNLKVVIFNDKGASDGYSKIEDFIYGKTTDFVGIYDRSDYDRIDLKENDDRHAIAFYFLSEKPTYDQFIAHEIAHNVFDIEYAKYFGKYIEKDGIPAVPDDYSDKMRNVFSNIIKEAYPDLDINRFEFNRQQICEIFAMLYDREFCNRKKVNVEVNSKVEQRCREFIANPEDELLKYNYENNRNCTLDDFYSENHILSLIISPLVENKYADFNDRLALFWN